MYKAIHTCFMLVIFSSISWMTYAQTDHTSSQLIAPDFSMTMEDGSFKKLSDFKGEVLYISFWASWCQPCISNFKKYEDMRTQLKAIGITLLNVSIDESPKAWKGSLAKQNLSGINAISSKEILYPNYQISSVPLYEIIGKDGTFKYLSEGENRDIIEEFRAYLNE